ncbi:nicotinamide riboside transporter PnuC [Qipengyuania sediminis]|uniref:nicotinamide riboside transporter PnuC n=1 Tax=Qipengyuania sediminis TaxID=1532023 RepID=UPI001059A2DB|nr:nicotinamide riboside transporter PnuC [Qipengyuania sediminis]
MTDPLELAAVAFGLANITLLVRRSIWNFPFGICMVTLYFAIFWRQRLYAEAGLQVFFALVNIYGWRLWARAGGAQEPVAVGWMGGSARIACLGFIAVAALTLGASLDRWTDAAMPFPDAAIAAASIAAQFLLSFRRIENWVLWIAIDVGAIALYIARDLHLTAGLYAAFLVLSVMGLRQWIAAATPKESEA